MTSHFKKNLLQVLGGVPAIAIIIFVVNLLMSISCGDYTSVENVIDISSFLFATFFATTLISINAFYLAIKNKEYGLDLKKLYQYLIVGLIAFVIPAMIFEKGYGTPYLWRR